MPKAVNKTKKQRMPTPALYFLKRIDRNALEQIKQRLKDSANKQLYLIIKSTGGNPYTAVRIVKHIRTKYQRIISIVPEHSYSASVLMLLGTNEILVSPEGYIAPIDLPMEHPATAETISALDVTQSLFNLAGLAKQNALSFYKSMRGSESVFPEMPDKKHAFEISWQSSVTLISPMVKKIDPVLLQKCYRDLKIGLYYGYDLLRDYMFPRNPRLCWEIASKLVNIFPSHGYAIFREEMEKLGLKVDKLEENKDAEKLLALYDRIKSGIKYIDDVYA